MQLGSLFILCLDAAGIMTIVTIALHQTTDHRSLPLQINHDMHDLNCHIKEASFRNLACIRWYIFAKFLNLIHSHYSIFLIIFSQSK